MSLTFRRESKAVSVFMPDWSTYLELHPDPYHSYIVPNAPGLEVCQLQRCGLTHLQTDHRRPFIQYSLFPSPPWPCLFVQFLRNPISCFHQSGNCSDAFNTSQAKNVPLQLTPPRRPKQHSRTMVQRGNGKLYGNASVPNHQRFPLDLGHFRCLRPTD